MKKFIFTIFFLVLITVPVFAEEEIFLINEDSVLEETVAPLESKVEATALSDEKPPYNKFYQELSKNAHDVFKLEIDNIDTPSCLFGEVLTHEFEKGPLETVHFWTGIQMNMSTEIPDEGSVENKFKVGLINNFIDGKFKGGKESFRIMLDPTPQNSRPFMQNLFQDLYIDTKRIPNHRILVGNSRPGVGHEGAGSAYTLPFASRSQISRNFGVARKLGVRVMGNYSLVDYDLGGYSSGTYFSDFFPGAEFNGWVNIKPLGKTDGKYGKLTTGGGIVAGNREDVDFFVAGAYVGYEYKKLWLKAEFADANGSNGATGLSDKKRQGWYATAGYRLTKKLELLARYDEFNPDKNIKNNNKREYTLGVNYYIKGQALRLILNYVFCQNDASPNSHRILLGTQIAI